MLSVIYYKFIKTLIRFEKVNSVAGERMFVIKTCLFLKDYICISVHDSEIKIVTVIVIIKFAIC